MPLNSKLKDFVNSDPGNYISRQQALIPSVEGMRIYGEPLIGVASAADPLFSKMLEPEVIGGHFLMPHQWLDGAKSVISIFLPYTDRIREANAEAGDIAVEWLQGRVEGQEFLLKTAIYVKGLVEASGCRAVIPFMDDKFWLVENHRDGYTSNWSERHIAYICGLGTFGLSKGIITKAGMAGRFVSIVTDMELPVTEREYTEVYQYCTFCGACVKRCPASAISLEKGKEHQPCGDLVHHKRTDYPDYYGCGKCQCGVPCQSGIPAK